MKIAVITDATSPDYYFPLWVKYYGDLFGLGNLYVGTYDNSADLFAGIYGINFYRINHIYHEETRVPKISDMIEDLLRKYDFIVLCDIDEIIVAPGNESLRSFIEQMNGTHVTAHGINLVEMRNDGPLDLAHPILGQRNFGIPAVEMSKTCITSMPLKWSAGFHSSSVAPSYQSIFNLHLECADIRARTRWCQYRIGQVAPFSDKWRSYSRQVSDMAFRNLVFSGYARQKLNLVEFPWDDVPYWLDKSTGFYERPFDSPKIVLSLEPLKGCC